MMVVLMAAAQSLVVVAAIVPPSLLPDKWPEFALTFVVATFDLGRRLADVADRRGHANAWGWMAVLGPIGVVVVYFLPDRTAHPGHGFPVELKRAHKAEGEA